MWLEYGRSILHRKYTATEAGIILIIYLAILVAFTLLMI